MPATQTLPGAAAMVSRADRTLLSFAFLCVGAMLNFGNFSPAAVVCMLISVGFGLHSVLARSEGNPLPRGVRIAVLAAVAATVVWYPEGHENPIFWVTGPMSALAVIGFALTRTRLRRAAAAAVAVMATAGGIAANLSWGSAPIDVFDLQQNASQALLLGHDPYAGVVPSLQIVAPGVRRFIGLHFPYGPIVPVLEAPFRLLGDVRVLHAVAVLLTAAAILVLARRAGAVDRAAVLLMAFPFTAGMVVFAWVDSITVAGLVIWLTLQRSHPRVAVTALTVALAAKPTALIALVPMFFWSVRARRQILAAAALTALIVLPFAAVAGFSSFYADTVGIFLTVLPRLDSLTLNSLMSFIRLPLLPFALSALVVGGVSIAVLRRRPVTYGDVLRVTAVIVTVSFLVAKWAYFNYYYIPAVLLLMALTADRLPLDAPELIRPPAIVLAAGGMVRRLGRARRPVPAAEVVGRAS